jgi:hypothetical protein
MLKMILNDDNLHPINANNFSYHVTLEIENYTSKSSSLNFNTDIVSIPSIVAFENVPITSLALLQDDDTEIVTLSFQNDFYILNYNANIYEGGTNNTVSMGYIVRAQAPNP